MSALIYEILVGEVMKYSPQKLSSLCLKADYDELIDSEEDSSIKKEPILDKVKKQLLLVADKIASNSRVSESDKTKIEKIRFRLNLALDYNDLNKVIINLADIYATYK